VLDLRSGVACPSRPQQAHGGKLWCRGDLGQGTRRKDGPRDGGRDGPRDGLGDGRGVHLGCQRSRGSGFSCTLAMGAESGGSVHLDAEGRWTRTRFPMYEGLTV